MEFLTPCPELVIRPARWYDGDGWLKLAGLMPVEASTPNWPHPMRQVDTDRAAGIAAALGWGEVWAWE